MAFHAQLVVSFLAVGLLGGCGVEAPLDGDGHEGSDEAWMADAALDEEEEGWSLPEEGVAPPPAMQPTVWRTCGDPVCQGWQPKGYKRCGQQVVEGDVCGQQQLGRFCDPGDGCNTLLTCDTVDPTGGGNCPISKRDAKQDIRYLEGTDREALREELLGVKLARYRYKQTGDEGPVRLGFIIDDLGTSEAVAPSGDRVDLYGYTSMAVATLQQQQAELKALQAKVEKLEAACAAP